MEQEQLKVFMDSVSDYFIKMTGLPIEIGVPYLLDESKNILQNYTGVIGISGKMRGAIYITADGDLLYSLMLKIMPGGQRTDKRLVGMAGELANTIAGNAQKTLGKEFYISIPMLLTSEHPGGMNTFTLEAPTFVIPLRWDGHQASLVVGLRK